MSATVGTDLEVIQELDFEESKVCEYCETAEATFLMVNKCCRGSILLCTYDAEMANRQLLLYQLAQKVMCCNHCHTHSVPDCEFIPLGGV